MLTIDTTDDQGKGTFQGRFSRYLFCDGTVAFLLSELHKRDRNERALLIVPLDGDGADAPHLEGIVMSGIVDGKFTITATSHATGKRYTEQHGIFFKAEDPGVPDMLVEYHRKLAELGAGEHQLKAVELLRKRVVKFQEENGTKLPDVDPSTEPYLLIEGAL